MIANFSHSIYPMLWFSSLMRTRYRDIWGSFLCLAFCLMVEKSLARGIYLPDLGDPSYKVLSDAEERKLGRVLLTDIRANISLIEDLEVRYYLQSLGERIAKSNTLSFPFFFLLARYPSINAFATPGGVVVVNSGLFVFTSTESELAGVLSHEIAHIVLRHIPRNRQLAEASSWLQALAILSSIIAAAYNPEISQSLILGSQALSIEESLAYSRTFEFEADFSGIRMLYLAGFTPQGMPDFFSRLLNHENSLENYEFLRTHPLALNRLADARERAHKLPSTGKKTSALYEFTRARLAAIENIIRPTFSQNLREAGQAYYDAIVLSNRGDFEKSIRLLRSISLEDDYLVPVHLALAQAYMQKNKNRQAEVLLENLVRLYPRHVVANIYLSQAYLQIGMPDKAALRLAEIRYQRAFFPMIYRLLSKASEMSGQLAKSHEYLSDFYSEVGKYREAITQLDIAEKNGRGKKTLLSRIKAKKQKLEKLKEQLLQIN